MIKMTAFSCRPDERQFFEEFAKMYQIELVMTDQPPILENVDLLKGAQAACVITTPVSGALLEQWSRMGVRLVSTRTVGFEHIDCKRATERGIAVTNATYTPNTVAEYTVMTILMAIRKMKTILIRGLGQDYSLAGIRGRELKNMTVGVVGTGRIGETVAKILSGFGCRIVAYDVFQKESVRQIASYQELDKIWEMCDLITFHTPATPETFHMVNEETLAKMKDGVVLINMARGSMFDTPALIDALERGKVGAAALDVVENEGKIYYKDFKECPVPHHEMAILGAMPNVLMTPHTAFFTDEAVSDMVECAMKSCKRLESGEDDPLRVN